MAPKTPCEKGSPEFSPYGQHDVILFHEHIVYTKSLARKKKDGNTTEGDDAVVATWPRNLFPKSDDDEMKIMIGTKGATCRGQERGPQK
jgi:hypothetical protein